MCVYLYRLVRSANLGANFLTAAAVRALRLDASPALKTLDLAGNDLGEEGAAALARALADEGCGVECLGVANTGLLRAGTRFACPLYRHDSKDSPFPPKLTQRA